MIDVLDLGKMAYEDALILQKKYHQEIADGLRKSTLLLVEHPPVFTLGIRGGMDHLNLSLEACEALGIQVVSVERGGDITYHGPGQIVGYPILNLRELNMKIRHYVYGLEDMMIQLLKSNYHIEAIKGEGKYTGVFVGDDKIMAIGIEVKQGTTMHGFAFNVNTDLRYFDYITPCGLSDKGVTSLAQLCQKEQDILKVKEEIIQGFKSIIISNKEQI